MNSLILGATVISFSFGKIPSPIVAQFLVESADMLPVEIANTPSYENTVCEARVVKPTLENHKAEENAIVCSNQATGFEVRLSLRNTEISRWGNPAHDGNSFQFDSQLATDIYKAGLRFAKRHGEHPLLNRMELEGPDGYGIESFGFRKRPNRGLNDLSPALFDCARFYVFDKTDRVNCAFLDFEIEE